MRALQPSDETGVVSTTRRARRRSRVGRPIAALTLASAMVLGSSAVAANAIDVPYPPGPTVVADPNSPTGYTGHFVYCNPERDERAIRRRHHAAQLGGSRRTRRSTRRSSTSRA